MKLLAVALCAMLGSTAATSRASAQAVEARPIRGEMLVNAGAGYRAIAEAVQVKPGDAVIAGDKALGRLTYADGCSVDVAPGSIVWVQARSPCGAATGPVPTSDPAPALVPGIIFDPSWLSSEAVLLDMRRPAAGP